MSDAKKIDELLNRGIENVYPSREAFEEALQSGKKLTIYYGIDPTGQLHIGHGVQFNKLRQFQELGHKVILLIGDFTAMIGDPTDKSATRKSLTREQVLENAKDYESIISKILDPALTEFRFNSEWHSKMTFEDVLKLSSEFTVQQFLERDMFDKRMKEGKPIHLHEFLYPLMQGYDSVALDTDVEIGGNDQMFNMLAGRTLLKSLKNKEKFVITTKLLVDPTGKKMGKTEGNMVNLADAPEEMYGKVMSWTDGMIVPGFEIAVQTPWEDVQRAADEIDNGANPKDIKMRLARELVSQYYSPEAAQKAEEQFTSVFSESKLPEEIQEFSIVERNIVDVLVATKLVTSKSEARRAIEQGGVKVDGEVVSEVDHEIEVAADGTVIQKGKRHFAKIR